MKQNYIFVIVLLATLSLINAFPHQLQERDTTFVPCPSGSPNPIKVTVKPDPPPVTGSFVLNVSGTLKTGVISAGSKLVVKAIGDDGELLDDPIVYDMCESLTCPTKYFDVVAYLKSKNLLPTFSIIVQVLSASGKTLGCSIGTVTGA
ncbi:hypothetical protein RhiirA5_431863 [Rhizophagus irregularis]|uniref:Phosphatidylglycerol/phosphatidylinositol transfer protein n=3 Tax=Rhizophagus irregularis TaxID=588596 RepID=U9SUS7_RHIID|nr:hypothetical protein GLOIN_2v1771726 [Rhizophagus irregularis DAOM 181602=DAOM 197198]EXX67870.1 hypothetical protein RirG_110340 [Rhizophagus irregularis DAOM 197198w]PKB98142.1 hypothetical protein RhiirA5_431863 [Rhizophagus irregularis]PKC58629.1 hypothetical protein RhiirA1_470677 [Rhizophagus irregularis]PKY29075.1 hypothetical protein RhiirB3_391533 [Rhizophagus irregularis]POG74112.1 hypothetical protein GLOIN_2v1771726 [Rhizophagus irregularis DAOM 181602=DAOM 197198]|eukprot:XP_025180978.1 hypothetical protein GLOIN_2v1771726 [Rhizophagus irregularis DAOM 181602=DAOM 197198]